MTINDRVRVLREKLKYTQTEFGKKIDVSQNYLSNIEKGYRPVTPKILKLICKEYNANEEWLSAGEGEMFKTSGELSEIYGEKLKELDETDKKIILEYLKLSTRQRAVIKEFLRKTFS
jgi:transcriptional regulator with XRE-family HTH domain